MTDHLSTDETPTDVTAAPEPELLFNISREQIEELTAEAVGTAEPDLKVLSERETRSMFERSIARSHCSPQGLAHLFPGLKAARKK